MSEQQKLDQSAGVDRRELVRRGVKAAYMVPVILAAVKATERPAYADTSGAPIELKPISPIQPGT